MSKKKNGEAGKEKTKKRLSVPKIILVSILGLLVLAILGVGGYTLIKLYGMSRNAVKTVEKPVVEQPDVTPEPGVTIIEGEDLANIDLTEDYDTPIDPKDIYAEPIYSENQIDPDIINILLLGDDGRDALDTGRSDSMMILSYNQATGQVKILSLLRDTWIYIPGRTTWNRINTAYRFGGVGLAINTINTNFDMDIQYYMLVHFDDIKGITDTVGGVDVPLTQREVEYINAYSGSDNILADIPEGVETEMRHLDGLQAFRHSRNRKLGNGDWSRTERQRNILKGFYQRAKQEKNATALASLMYSLMDYVETNMTPWQMISLGTSIIFGHSGGEPQTGTMPFPGTWNYAYEGQMAVIHINIEKNRDAMHEFIFGRVD